MIYFYFSNRILSIFFIYIIILYEKFHAFQSEGTPQFQTCNVAKRPYGNGVIKDKNWWYNPTCKEDRPDLFTNIQVGRTDKFCVNVTTGIPFYRTAKSKSKDLNCDIALFKLIIKTQSQAPNISAMIKSKLEEIFLGSIGSQIVKIVAQENSFPNLMVFHFEIYSIGHRSTNDILSLIKSRINEGQIGPVEFDSDKSNMLLVTSNLEDPPRVPYFPKKAEMATNNEEFSIGEIKKRNAVILDEKNKNTGQNKLDTGFIFAIVIMVVIGCIVIVLSVLYCIYRLRKKDEGSYVLNKNIVLTNDKARKNMVLASNAKEYFA